MNDRSRCMASKDGTLGGDRCQEPATHLSHVGRRCARHAEELKEALRNPETLGNLFAGGRARTELEIARIIVPLS